MSIELPQSIRELGAFLIGDASPEDAMLLSELDGLLSGVIVCRAPILKTEWMPLVWGGEGPEFKSMEMVQTINDLIKDHHNFIVERLEKDEYQPLFDVDHDNNVLWELWVEGFWRSVNLRPDAWVTLCAIEDDDVAQATFCLTRLYEIASTPEADLAPMDIDAELVNLAPGLIAHAVEILHRTNPVQTALISASTTEALPKLGRNDPCPCGSGKKAKKCCFP